MVDENDFVSVPGIGDFVRTDALANTNWFELGRMNFRNEMASYGFENLADNDQLVRAYIYYNNTTNPVEKRQLAYQ